MECLHCKGKLARKKVSYTVNRKGYHHIARRIKREPLEFH